MSTCYFLRSMTLLAREQMQPIATMASGRALIFVDADGRISGVIEAPVATASAVSAEDGADDAAPTVGADMAVR